jgi:hypothetical protein
MPDPNSSVLEQLQKIRYTFFFSAPYENLGRGYWKWFITTSRIPS